MNMTFSEEKFKHLFGTRISQKRERFLTYVKSTPPRKIFAQGALPSLVGMTLGGTVGGIVGIVGGPKGAVFGAGSGAGVGLLAGGTYTGYQTRKEYKKWLRQHRSDEILAEFREIINEHSDFQEFVCPLTEELMHYPLVDPWGHSYERKAMESWVRRYGVSPKNKRPIKIAELRPNYFLMGKLAEFYRRLVKEEVTGLELSSLQKKGIQALLSDLEQQIKNCFDAENRILYSLLLQEKINARTYASQLAIMADLFYAR